MENLRIEDTPIAMLTAKQLKEYLNAPEPSETEQKADTPKTEKRYVYGISGICELFHVSQATAQRYKDGILKGAIMQNGRKIICDVDKAMELFNAK